MPGLADTALHISETERRAMLAERDAADRYKVSFMSRKIGEVFEGAIAGLNVYGLFVNLIATGITGFIPVRNLGRDFFTYDKKHSCFRGRSSGTSFALGTTIMIRVQEANAMTASLIFVPESASSETMPPLRHKYSHKKSTGKDEKYSKKDKGSRSKKHAGKKHRKR